MPQATGYRPKQGQRATHVTLVLQVTLLSWPYLGTATGCQTNAAISSRTDCCSLGRVGCGRDVCCRQRSGFEDKRGHPVCAARFLVISRWHLARRAGGLPHVPGVWIELMAAKPLWHKRTARRSTVAAESHWRSLTPRPCVAQVSFPHA
jgi:hypothetical protein